MSVRRRAVLLAAALAVTTASVVIAAYLSTGASDGEENERLLAELPRFPDSEIVEITEYAYHRCGWPIRRQLGSSMAARYRAPSGATAEEIIAFYMGSLGGEWQATREDIGIASPGYPGQPGEVLGSIPAAHFVKGTATVHVSTESMVDIPGDESVEPQAGYDFGVVVDSEGTVERPYCD